MEAGNARGVINFRSEKEQREEEGEDEDEDGTVSLKREPTHQGMVGKKHENIDNFGMDLGWFGGCSGVVFE